MKCNVRNFVLIDGKKEPFRIYRCWAIRLNNLLECFSVTVSQTGAASKQGWTSSRAAPNKESTSDGIRLTRSLFAVFSKIDLAEKGRRFQKLLVAFSSRCFQPNNR